MMLSQLKVWLIAARPKTLTAAFVPVVLGAMLSLRQNSFDWLLFLCTLFAALFIQLGTNFFNDAIDFLKGTDTVARLGPQRVTQSGLLAPRKVLCAGVLAFFVALAVSLPLLLKAGWPIFLIGVFSLLLGYAYTGGAFPLSYKGIGEFFVLLFFGVIAVAGTTYIQTNVWMQEAFLAGLQVGCLATALLAVNNLRDVETDKQAEKKTFPVRFGIRAAKVEVIFLLLFPFILQLFWWQQNMFAAFLPFFIFPLAIKLCFLIWKTAPSTRYNQLLAKAALLHFLFGLLLAGGLWWG